MNLLPKRVWAITVILLAPYYLSALENPEHKSVKQDSYSVKKKIEAVVNNYVLNSAFEGAILVSKSGQIIFEKTFGFSDRSEDQPTTINNSFQLASLSKPITATLVLILVEQGKLKLENRLADYFPEFNNNGGKEITLHHLLSHTSGIPNHFIIEGWFDTDFRKTTTEHEFVEILAKLPPKFEPGTDYLYSNPGYFLLGKITEKVTQESYSDNLQKYIFGPLNMNKSGVSADTNSSSGVVKGYQWDRNGAYRDQAVKNMTLFGAGGAIFSNTKDLYKFDLALYGEKLLKEKSKEHLLGGERPYGWEVGAMPLFPTGITNFLTFSGQIEGYSSMMTRFVDDRHSIILLSNIGMNSFLSNSSRLI